jgi:hypothetical protein
MIKTIYVLGIWRRCPRQHRGADAARASLPFQFPGTARATGIIGVCLLFFSLEHFVGLGSLYPLFLPLTALSLFVIWTERAWFSDETSRTSERELHASPAHSSRARARLAWEFLTLVRVRLWAKLSSIKRSRLTDHDVRYVVWSIRESKNIDAWKSIMQVVDADYRWMEFSTTPEAHVGLWVRR